MNELGSSQEQLFCIFATKGVFAWIFRILRQSQTRRCTMNEPDSSQEAFFCIFAAKGVFFCIF